MNKKLLLMLLLISTSIILAGCEFNKNTDINNFGSQNSVKNNPENPEPNNPDTPGPIEEDLCSALNQEECFDNKKCRGIYGPSTCSGDICTTDESFKKCVKIPEENLEQAKLEQELCENTRGTWKGSEFSEPGGCECSLRDYVSNYSPESHHKFGQVRFVEKKGCISAKEICLEKNGIWEKPKPYSVNNRSDISRSECVSSSNFTLMNWDEKNDVCILSRFKENSKCLIDGEEVYPFKL